jgi:hypothetical protein
VTDSESLTDRLRWERAADVARSDEPRPGDTAQSLRNVTILNAARRLADRVDQFDHSDDRYGEESQERFRAVLDAAAELVEAYTRPLSDGALKHYFDDGAIQRLNRPRDGDPAVPLKRRGDLLA